MRGPARTVLVHVRLAPEEAERLHELGRRLGLTSSDVVREALDHLHTLATGAPSKAAPHG